MTTPSTQDLLKYARVQMAAEAMLNPGKWADGSDRRGGYDGTDLEAALRVGNNHSSRFTATDAEAFRTEGWIVKEQIETDTGFSGTLFYNTKTFEHVVSFRSTEFIDDHIRDNVCTNTQEIFEAGFAFGQLRDMEAWMEKLRTLPVETVIDGQPTIAPLLPANAEFTVTGYSLGAHLASAYNQMHGPGSAAPHTGLKQVITFNGGGVGRISDQADLNGMTLNDVIDEFSIQSSSDYAFTNASVRGVYERTRDAGGVMSNSDRAVLQAG